MTGVPLARTREGAILGVDQRRLRGMIPGRFGAQFVCPGDRIIATGMEVLVLSISASNVIPGSIHIVTQTDKGAEIVVERQWDEPVRVVSAGAFDRD